MRDAGPGTRLEVVSLGPAQMVAQGERGEIDLAIDVDAHAHLVAARGVALEALGVGGVGGEGSLAVPCARVVEDDLLVQVVEPAHRPAPK